LSEELGLRELVLGAPRGDSSEPVPIDVEKFPGAALSAEGVGVSAVLPGPGGGRVNEKFNCRPGAVTASGEAARRSDSNNCAV
jgi:hypothetical protein